MILNPTLINLLTFMTLTKSNLPFPLLACFAIGLASCQTAPKKENREEQSLDIRAKVDLEVEKLKSNITEFDYVLSIDHARLAEEAGVYTPPYIVTLFSNAKVNAELLELNPLVGLDLPYKVLCYSEPDTAGPSIAYTSADFIRKRHGLSEAAVVNFAGDIEKVVGTFPEKDLSPTGLEKVDQQFGIISLRSDFDFNATVERLREVILSQGDTKWFGEIDFQKEARDLNIDIGKTTLLLFGGPAPGGKAMFDSPKLGLDAFCQKLLISENEQAEVSVSFNDISAFANLYYGRSTKPQEMINARLKNTFEKAVKQDTK